MASLAYRPMWWTLRVAAAACFIGHGAFGLRTKAEWVPFFAIAGISPDVAYVLMPLIGAVDVAVGIAVLLRPSRLVLLYMAAWALWTAALRPLSGDSVLEFFERAGNYGVPLALLLMLGPPQPLRDLVSAPPTPSLAPKRALLVSRVLAGTTALLLFGHGALATLAGKDLLREHFASIGLPPEGAAVAGCVEMALAVLVLGRPRPGLLVAVACWKVATEMLYPIAGAPVWEFIERGGSYGAPLALAILLARGRVRDVEGGFRAASRLAIAFLVTALATPANAQESCDGSLVTALRRGGYVLAFRHAATDHDATDRGPDRASQRNLTDEGTRQAQAIGTAVRALGIPIGEVRANPMFRNRETAEHAFGRVTVDSTLGGEGAASALRRMLSTVVTDRTNHVVVTRIGILNGAFEGHDVGLIHEGDGIIVEPLGEGRFRVVCHLSWADWAKLAP